MNFKSAKLAGIVFIIYIFAMLFMLSCNKNLFFPEVSSSPGEDESHNMGENCMTCHKPRGSGEYTWYVAGTLYDRDKQNTADGGKVHLYTKPNGGGERIATLDIDARGNFYTSKRVSFSGGLYPAVQSTNGTVIYMQEGITGGACNYCHNHSTEKIFSD